MKRLFKIKYPKIAILILFIIFAYLLFSDLLLADKLSKIHDLNYIGVFLFGTLFSFGFTTPFAIGFFITLNPQNIWITAMVGGFGAMFADLLIFKFVKFSFKDEFEKLKKEKISKKINKAIRHTLGKRIQHYLMYVFAGIIIASPLPDEAGVTMLAGLTTVNAKWLALIGFLCNTIGILLMLLI